MCFNNFCVHSNVISVFAQVLRKLNDIVFCVIVVFVEKQKYVNSRAMRTVQTVEASE